MHPLAGIILFTVIETIGLVVWLILAGLPFDGQIAAVIVLLVFLFFEHLVAFNVGTGRPFFEIPQPRPKEPVKKT